MASDTDRRRAIPGVDRLLARPWCGELAVRHGRGWVTDRLRSVLAEVRTGAVPRPLDDDGYADLVAAEIADAESSTLTRVINATGVVLHTNLGRAPLAPEAVRAMAAAAGYGNIEFDLETGRRGSRYLHCADLVRELCGSEDSLVVNNGAGALALALAALAPRRGVVVSHGELVEIGGGFRIPEVIGAAGSRLATVGTTNRTRVEDYEAAVEEGDVGAILKVHRSNFSMSGYTGDASLAELVALGDRIGVPVIHDLGSGLLIPSADLGLPFEPTPAESVAAGADLVVFSGDKLLGGPQAGVMAGTARAVGLARSHPLCRALRCDKVTLAGLAATLRLHRDPELAKQRIPALRMVSIPVEELRRRAEQIVATASRQGEEAGLPPLAARVDRGHALVGGGTFPDARIPSVAIVAEAGEEVNGVLARLRSHDPPIVARGRRGRVFLDLRAVDPADDMVLASALAKLPESE
ncbi:MAG: L-seryl-tRNA(Sec) selenium transferase [Gemmatimonadetes bacterium]|nr:L-seryl-tRNA(Sec) selenium transferase [Gemmatimonadota bacterium]